jgi:hypothetical protein
LQFKINLAVEIFVFFIFYLFHKSVFKNWGSVAIISFEWLYK